MVKPYQEDLKIVNIEQDDIFYLNNLLLNTLFIGLHTKEAQYSYYLDITDILSDLKRVIIPIDKNQSLLSPILTSGRLAQNNKEIVINPTYAWNNNLKVNDSISLFDKIYKIVGFATNIFINNNYSPLTSLTNSIYYWMDKKEYESIAQTHLSSHNFLINCSFLETNNLNESLITNYVFKKTTIKRNFS